MNQVLHIMPFFCKEKKYFAVGVLAFGLFFCFGLINFARADFSSCGITPVSPLWQVKTADGAVVLAIDSVGNMDIVSANVYTNTAPPASGLTDTLIIKTSSANKFTFNKTDAYIAGSVMESQASLPAVSGDDLVVKNSVGAAVALFDATTGNIYLKGQSCGVAAIAAGNIFNCTDLQNMKNDLTGNYALANDIDCSATVGWNGGKGFIPVGASSGYFMGKLDGQGFTIINLTINRPKTDDIGLFGVTGSTSEVKNIGLVNVNITGGSNVGGLVGTNVSGAITHSYSTGNIKSKGDSSTIYIYIGGLVGQNLNGAITNSYSTASVTGAAGSWMMGGLVGWNSGTITNSFSTGKVKGGTSSSMDTGGLVGRNSGVITNSYSIGSVDGVSASYYTGGLVGWNSGAITNSFSTGSVKGGTSINVNTGGFVGTSFGSGASITNSYWNTQTSGQSSCICASGGTGKTTAQMKQQATYSGWIFPDPWTITESTTYPCHKWYRDIGGVCPQ